MKKKALSLLLVLSLCLTLLPTAALAADTQGPAEEQTQAEPVPGEQEESTDPTADEHGEGENDPEEGTPIQETEDGEEETPEDEPQVQEGEPTEPMTPEEPEVYTGITFRYGDGETLEVELPEDMKHYTYGTSSADGTEITVTEENADSLPKTGWNWAVCETKSGGAGTTGDLYNSQIGTGYALRLRDFHLVNNGSGAAIESQVTLYIDLWNDSEVTAADPDSAAILVGDGARMRITSIMDNGLVSDRAPFDQDDEVGLGTLTAQGGAYGLQSTYADDSTYYYDIAIGGSARVTAIGEKAGVKAEGLVHVRGLLTAIGTGEDSYGIITNYLELDEYYGPTAYNKTPSGIPLELTAEGKKAAFSVGKKFWNFTDVVEDAAVYTGKVGTSAADAEDWTGTDASELAGYKYARFLGNGVATVSNFADLKAAVNQSKPEILRIYVTGDCTIASTLYLEHQVAIIGVGDETPVLSRDTKFTSGSLFQVGAYADKSSTDYTHGHVRMKNLIIDGKNVQASAPAIYLERGATSSEVTKGYGRLLLSDVEIRNCINKGSTMNNEGTKYEVQSENKAGTGGAIRGRSSGTLSMQGGKITNCTAYYGGAVYLQNPGEFYDVTFSNNQTADLEAEKANSTIKGTASGDGGAIYCVSGSWGTGSAYLYNCTVSDNKAAKSGGGLGGGGGFYVYDGSVIENNTAAGDGGGIYTTYYYGLVIKDSTIRNNEATGTGGGVYMGMSAKAAITNCQFLNNKAAKLGGGLYAGGGAITDCTIQNNSALHGGGVYSSDGTVTGCIISGNEATYYGGGVYAYRASVTDCQISGSSAQDGGGIYGHGTITGGEVTGNTTTGNGGGIYITGKCAVTGTKISGNQAVNGGGIYESSYSSLNLDKVEISGNTAEKWGGGLYLVPWRYSNTYSDHTTKDTKITNNTAANGGGVYLERGSGNWFVSGATKIQNNTLTDGTTANNLFVQKKNSSIPAGVITIGRDEVKSTDSDGNETVTTVGLPGLSGDAYIGVTLETYPDLGVQTTVAKCGLADDNKAGDTPDYGQYFHPEAEKYVCITKVDATTGDDGTETSTRTVVLQRQIIALDKPTSGAQLPYSGQPQNGAAENEGYTLSGHVGMTNVGNYTTTVTLKDGYKWSDDSTDAVTVTWSITAKTPEAGDFTFTAPGSPTYDGHAKTAEVAWDSTKNYTGCGQITAVKYFKNGIEVQPIDAGTYTVKITVAAGGNFTAAEDLTDDSWSFTILQGGGLAAPDCSFSFDGDNAGKLMGAADGMEYSLDGGKTWTDCTAGMLLPVNEITTAGIQVRMKKTNNNAAGEKKIIAITANASIPAAGKVDCLSKNATGSLTGVGSTMEYSKDGGTTWIAIDGDKVEGLAAGKYKVRYKAAGTVLPSAAQDVTIEAYVLKSDKAILSFAIDSAVGTVDEENHTVAVTVPYGTDVNALTPTIEISALATVSPASGAEQDFTKPVTYSVTAENETRQVYTVTVTVADPALLTVTAPGPKTLANFAETADDATIELPTTVTITSQSSATELPCSWTLKAGTTFDRTPKATNTFHWTADTTGFAVNGQTVEGDVTVTNRAAIKLAVEKVLFDRTQTPGTKTYDGGTGVETPMHTEGVTGLLEGDQDKVYVRVVNAEYDSADVGDPRMITVTYEVKDGTDGSTIYDSAWKYEAPDPDILTGAITPRKVTLTDGISAVSRKYEWNNTAVTLNTADVTFDNLADHETLGVTVVSSTVDSADVGNGKHVTYTVELTDGSGENGSEVGKASNYKLVGDLPGVTVNIIKAAGGSFTADTASQKYTDTSEKTYRPDRAKLPDGQDWTFSVDAPVCTGSNVVADYKVDTDGVLTYQLSSNGKVDDKITFTVRAKCGNYEDYIYTLEVTLRDKDSQTALKITNANQVTYGTNLPLTYTGGSDTGKDVVWSVVNGADKAHIDPESGELVPDQVGTVTVKAFKEGNADYFDAEDTLEIIIGKKTVTITVLDKSAYVGDAEPDLSNPELDKDYTVEGLIGEDALTGTLTLTYESDPDMTKTGETAIKASGVDAGANYTIEYVVGKLIITNRPSSGGGSTTYPVNVPSKTESGTVTVSTKNASKGSTVTITVKPESGYQLDSLIVTDKDGNELKLTDKGNGQYTFTMPAGKVEVNAAFAKETETSPFADVATNAYYYEAVKWAADQEITGGIGNGLFGPNQPCTRAQIVTFLWRAAGSPEPKNMSSFSDVPADSYYAKAVAWAVENGITTGTGNGKFSPDVTCTRAQSVTFLFRASEASADGTPAFSDVAANAYYAEAVKWATDNGITNGIGNGLFGSNNDCTRAQIVTFLWRLYAGK